MDVRMSSNYEIPKEAQKIRFPKMIHPVSIIDSTIEIHFNNNNSNDIPDSVVNLLKKRFIESSRFNEFSDKPILQLSQEIRMKDKSLMYAPYYESTSDHLKLQIGPNVISLSNVDHYIGWENLRKESENVLNIFNDISNMFRIAKIGFRYTDFFKNIDIFKNIKLKMKYESSSDEPFSYSADAFSNRKTSYIITETELFDTTIVIRIANNSFYEMNNVKHSGSFINIDAFLLFDNKELSIVDIVKIIGKLHHVHKHAFFGLLKEDFLNSLNPEY